MGTKEFAYIFGDAICLIMLLFISNASRRHTKILLAERYFLEMSLATAILLISDIIWPLVDGVKLPGFRLLNIIINLVYMVLMGFIGFLWIVYVDFKVRRRLDSSHYKRVTMFSIPMLVLLVLTLTSPKTHILFYIDENNCYHRGKLMWIRICVMNLYVLWAAVLTLVGIKRQKTKQKKDEMRALLQFIFFPIIGIFMQLFYMNLPFAAVGISLSVLLVFINVQNKQISIDALTGINNRRQLTLYVDSELSALSKKGELYYLIMDVDKFKSINDTYGHLEGDNALIKIASLLNSLCEKQNDFVARYGGDEFVIVCRRHNEAEVEALKQEILSAVSKLNDEGTLPYTLSLSVGSAKFDTSKSNDEIFAEADKKLYSIKSERTNVNA